MKRIVLGMSMERKALVSKIDNLSEPIGDQLCKLILYNDVRQDDIEGWAHEIADKLQVISEITCKPKNKKLSSNAYSKCLLAYFGDSEPDMKLCLLSVAAANSKKLPPYPKVEINSTKVRNGIKFVNSVVSTVSNMLSDNAVHYNSANFQDVILRAVQVHLLVSEEIVS